MAGHEAFIGGWEISGLPVAIVESDEGLLLHLPGTPAGFDAALEPTAASGRFVIRRGTFDGVVVDFGDGALGEARVGPMELVRSSEPFREPPGHGLLAPDMAVDVERDERYAAIEAGFGTGAAVVLDDPSSKHEFVQWLMGRDRYIFHGSNNRQIDEFRPIRTSVELLDHGGRGNLGAVYGTHDGLWSMFFAVIDRVGLVGSIRNGVMRFDSPEGDSVDVYHFSINDEMLPKRPYTHGALYVLPRDTFRRLPYWPGGPPSNEWASEESVRPLSRLLVEPADFPFLDRIGGHDDGPLLRMQELARQLVASATNAAELEDGFSVTIAWSDATGDAFEEWLALWQHYMPGTVVDLEGSGDERLWTLRGPPAVKDSVRSWLGPLPG